MNIFLYVAIAVVLALLSSRVMKLIKLPNVTGYLLTGIIVGPCVLGLFFNNFDFQNSFTSGATIYDFIDSLSWISTLALGFIAFTIGNNFKLSAIKTLGKRVVIITIFEAIGAALFVFIGLTIAHFVELSIVSAEKAVISWPLVLTLSAISCATAPAATLLVIKQYKADGPLVRTLLPVVALDDAAALIMFSILFGVAKTIKNGTGADVGLMILKPITEIVLSVVIGAAFGIVISLLAKLFKSRANRTGLCIFAILANIGIYYLFSNIELPYFGKLELSYLLMCMLSSAVFINAFKNNMSTMDRLDQITPIIYMLFFVLSGANLNLTIFASEQVLILFVIALTYALFRAGGKYFGSYLSMGIVRCEPQVKKYFGFTLIPQAGVAIGLATSASRSLGNGHSLGALIVACILMSTIIYELVGPVITKISLQKAGEIKEISNNN